VGRLPHRSAFQYSVQSRICMRFRLRTLLIVLAVAPPVLAALWFVGPPAWFLLFLAVAAHFVLDDSPAPIAGAMRLGIFVFAVATVIKLMSLAMF